MKAGFAGFAAGSMICWGMLIGGQTALGQFAGPAVGGPSTVSSVPPSAMNIQLQDVKIVPGDVISIATYGAPELSTGGSTSVDSPTGNGSIGASGIKVGTQGEIILPYLGVVKVGGRTPSEVALYLERELKEKGILVDPQVSVSLVASPTRVITVVGEVQKPAPVPAFGTLRLLDVISACGGFTPLASHTITVRRPGEAQPITVIMGTDPRTTDETNIPLMAGDTVIVPKVGNVFVIGQVKSPSAIPLSSNAPITVMRAIAMSGGVNFGAALSRVVVIRKTPNDQHVEIQMDLKKIMQGKQRDIALASDDVLLVPGNG
ncbi:MAG TPA: polysaccharide biosynthesis/export family protein, partial [Acidobacteriaceae bacterium]|nr:polysaccharide biosynthesis/export family protein [Acidobacteriaceae bacterium]